MPNRIHVPGDSSRRVTPVRRGRWFVLGVAVIGWLGATVYAQRVAPSLVRNHPAIAYATSPESDPVFKLNERLKSGEVTLESEPVTGYLRSVLKALNVPIESQLLVFSKTSFQAKRISPQNPRAIYFGDDVAVGFVRGGEVLEFISQDPKLGSIFYQLHQHQDGVPQFERTDSSCVFCHVSDTTHNVPGPFIGSVFPSPDGTANYGPVYMTDHRSPFQVRWGGWYVTGTHHADRHMGNAIASNPSDLAAMVTPQTVHVTSLEGKFDPTGYPSLTSDIVALMVLEHQAGMMNLITRANWDARLGADAEQPLAETVTQLVDYMLFVDEAPIPGPLEGPTSFAKNFSARGPFDKQGRSLHQLDTRTRLLKYPCSYMIYSEAFDALPDVAKSAVYARLWDVLSGKETDKTYDSLSPTDRQAIIEILRDTKPNLPDYFYPQPTGS
ncbi:MAG TPA: hypothetical protein VL173_01230 [Vicinamibacterales bacterium]|nr:hypothetical protein [Vicinamibacterales bacterium]